MRLIAIAATFAYVAAFIYTLHHDPLLFGVKGLAWKLVVSLYLLISVYLLITKHRFERRIRALAGKVCTNCGYFLTPELDHKPCPECGKPINLAQARADWIKEFGGWKQFPPP